MVRVFIVEPTRIIVRISAVAANWSSAIAYLKQVLRTIMTCAINCDHLSMQF
ncbi:hypothetical protein [Nostoc sp.]|uniref:hypothetical protein n=1 Tax=Nostoc sp. TaxID=1180 RepID=UPI002FF80CA8